MRERQTLAPKPFAWIDFPKDGQGKLLPPLRSHPSGHHQWSGEYTGTLECILTLSTPLHVGSGLYSLRDGQVVKEVFRQGDHLVIPGSSLKGGFRAIAEAMSLSCVSKSSQSMPSSYEECKDVKNMCICCSLFGGLGYLGCIRFHDAQCITNSNAQTHNIPTLWTPRQTTRGRKFYKHGTPAVGNDPYEVAPQGAQFQFRVDVESLTKPEMCLLLTAMGIRGGLRPKLGGGKPRCLGSVRVTLRHARFWSPHSDAMSYRRETISLNRDELIVQIDQHDSLVQKDMLIKLNSVLEHEIDGGCPSGLY